ncbi:MAG: ribosome maturation factor RimP [Pseudohongiellaceae bacterium]
MAGSAERVQQLIAPTVNALGVALWGVEYLSRGRRSLLRIYIDRDPGGVDVDDCERVSRQVSALLDVEDPIAGEYTLEVSSPGLDRPLFDASQFSQYAGHEVKLVLRMPVEGRRKLKGIIESVGDDTLTVVCDGEALTMPLTQIDRARLTY